MFQRHLINLINASIRAETQVTRSKAKAVKRLLGARQQESAIPGCRRCSLHDPWWH
jgi:hypothetical protein